MAEVLRLLPRFLNLRAISETLPSSPVIIRDSFLCPFRPFGLADDRESQAALQPLMPLGFVNDEIGSCEARLTKSFASLIIGSNIVSLLFLRFD